MNFGNPQILWLLLAWPLLALLGWRALTWRDRVAGRIGQAPLLARLYPASVRRWRARRIRLALAAMALLIIAASRPQYGQIIQTTRSIGTNVIIAMDCSGSMRAQDAPPDNISRIDSARRVLETLLRRLIGNRVGIVAFAGEAFLQCPMTLDQSMAILVLKSLDTQSVGVPGTDLGEAIKVATQAFERGAGDGGRALVLLTDGEDNEGKGLAAAREAAKKKIRIYAIGIGSARGALLPDERGGFKEDHSGAKVNSRLRMDQLEQIARASGGKAFNADGASAVAINNVVQAVLHQQQAEMESREQVLYQDRFQWFLAPALLLIVWMLLLRPEQPRLTHERLEESA